MRHSLHRHRLGRLLVVLVVAAALSVLPGASALAVPQISCASHQSAPPYNNYSCYVPWRFINYEVYLQAFPKQRELACDRTTDAQIHVQAAVKRKTTGFFLTGLWLVYDSGVKPYAFFQVDAWDGMHVYQNGPWNNYGNWMTRDVAVRSGSDITRFPGCPPEPSCPHDPGPRRSVGMSGW